MKEVPRVGDVHSWCHMVFLKLGVVQIVECSKCRFPGPASEPPFKRPGVGQGISLQINSPLLALPWGNSDFSGPRSHSEKLPCKGFSADSVLGGRAGSVLLV